MPGWFTRRELVIAAGAFAATPGRAGEPPSLQAVLDYAQSQRTTGFLIAREGRIIVERNWPLDETATGFRSAYTYGTTDHGALLEDVASQQKSFVAVLAAIATDKGLLDVTRSVSQILGLGWSKATVEQEAEIRVIHLLTMCSGLDEALNFAAPAGSTFLYNTPAYAKLKDVLVAVAGAPLDAMTRDWLTRPLGMADTAWRQRPAAFAGVGNPTGLVTCPRDIATLGQLILDGGRARDGRRVVSEAGMRALFTRSATNPAYGRLWWLNGSAETVRAGRRTPGPLVEAAPSDMVAGLGAMDRKLYVAPSLRLVVVRMGQAAPDRDFDQQLWLRLAKAMA